MDQPTAGDLQMIMIIINGVNVAFVS